VMPMSVLGQIYQARDVISGREMIQMQQSVCRRQMNGPSRAFHYSAATHPGALARDVIFRRTMSM
jgi:hypothetical protein